MVRLFRQLTKSGLRKLGFGIWAINSTETLNFENLLYVLFQKFKVVTFLHIGAHDGKSFSDPLYHFVTRNPHRVSGVMFEPVKETYKKLVSNLGHIKSIRLVNMAVHPYDKQVTIHKYSQVKGALAAVASGHSTTDLTRLDTRKFGVGPAAVQREVVSAMTISDALKWVSGFNDYGLHVICMDTEGLDFDLLDSIDFKTTKPFVIRFEHNLCDSKKQSYRDRYFSVLERLNREGYQVFTELNDAVAVSREMIPFIVEQNEG